MSASPWTFAGYVLGVAGQTEHAVLRRRVGRNVSERPACGIAREKLQRQASATSANGRDSLCKRCVRALEREGIARP